MKEVVSFADRLLRARLEMGARLGREVHQKEIAAEMGVEPSAYSQWEGGVREPRGRATYEKLAAVLGVSPGWLAFGLPIEEGVDVPLGASRKPQKRKGARG